MVFTVQLTSRSDVKAEERLTELEVATAAHHAEVSSLREQQDEMMTMEDAMEMTESEVGVACAVPTVQRGCIRQFCATDDSGEIG